jgi:hypothetical protein
VPADAAQDDARLDARGPSSAIWYVEVGRIRNLPVGKDVQMLMPPAPVRASPGYSRGGRER